MKTLCKWPVVSTRWGARLFRQFYTRVSTMLTAQDLDTCYYACRSREGSRRKACMHAEDAPAIIPRPTACQQWARRSSSLVRSRCNRVQQGLSKGCAVGLSDAKNVPCKRKRRKHLAITLAIEVLRLSVFGEHLRAFA